MLFCHKSFNFTNITDRRRLESLLRPHTRDQLVHCYSFGRYTYLVSQRNNCCPRHNNLIQFREFIIVLRTPILLPSSQPVASSVAVKVNSIVEHFYSSNRIAFYKSNTHQANDRCCSCCVTICCLSSGQTPVIIARRAYFIFVFYQYLNAKKRPCSNRSFFLR
jgi:hypothetical protein